MTVTWVKIWRLEIQYVSFANRWELFRRNLKKKLVFNLACLQSRWGTLKHIQIQMKLGNNFFKIIWNRWRDLEQQLSRIFFSPWHHEPPQCISGIVYKYPEKPRNVRISWLHTFPVIIVTYILLNSMHLCIRILSKLAKTCLHSAYASPKKRDFHCLCRLVTGFNLINIYSLLLLIVANVCELQTMKRPIHDIDLFSMLNIPIYLSMGFI